MSDNLADEIKKLHELKENGAITEEEFTQSKEKLLNNQSTVSMDVNTWASIIHLSQLLGLVVPVAGWLVPLIIWMLKKNESPFLDTNGRIVLNWIISEFIYALICVLLCLIIIGIPLLLILMIVGIVFPIIGGVKAGNGESWPYPCSIKFLKY